MLTFSARAFLAVLLLSTLTGPLSGQDKTWKLATEVGASVFFGASEQAATTLGADYELTSDELEFEVSGNFDYGESRTADGGRFVSQRGWELSSTLDYRPEAHFSPFVIVNTEGSFARQIDRRVSGGAGAKLRVIQGEDASLDFSLAALVERTEPRDQSGVPDVVESSGRWSMRARGRRVMGEGKISTGATLFYRPAMSAFGSDYTVDVQADLTVALSGITSLKFSLVDRYDALAKSRGARSNNDGRLFVSVVAAI